MNTGADRPSPPASCVAAAGTVGTLDGVAVGLGVGEAVGVGAGSAGWAFSLPGSSG